MEHRAAEEITGRDRFLRALNSQPVDRPPIWLMRQAGRALPEYRALKEKYTFVQLVQSPDLATEVTLQPIRRFHFDGAVIFSDILIASEGMGQKYRFRETGGIEMEFTVRTADDVNRLSPQAVPEKTQYLAEALKRVKKELGNQSALLGFAGSPWTLANYMLEGGSHPEPLAAKQLLHANPSLFNQLLTRITDAVIALLKMQIEAGADALQIFDTCGELLAADSYETASGQWIRKIVDALPPQTPVLRYVRGAPQALPSLADSNLRGFSIDWRMNLHHLRQTLPAHKVLQGNLDPSLMLTTPEVVTRAATHMLEPMRHATGYIANLGHGLPAGSKLENIEALCQTVRSLKA